MEHHLHSTTDTSAKLQSSIPGAGRTVGKIAKETVLISHSITTMRCDLTHTTHSNIPSSSKVSNFLLVSIRYLFKNEFSIHFRMNDAS